MRVKYWHFDTSILDQNWFYRLIHKIFPKWKRFYPLTINNVTFTIYDKERKNEKV